LGRFDDAAQWAASASAIHVKPGVVEFRVGRALYAAGRLDQAIAHLERANRLDPERAETSYALGQALLDAGKPADAIPHLRRAFDAGVRTDVAGYDLARALAATGARRDALEVLRRVTPARSEDAASWLRLGQLARQLGDVPLAADRYREAARSAPHWAEPREQLGLLLVLSGDNRAGIRELEAATAVDGSDATAHLNLAVAYAQVGRIDDARRHAREALRLDPAYTRAADLLEALDR
jgi:tetratricopeptide (TPR) repeat protein